MTHNALEPAPTGHTTDGREPYIIANRNPMLGWGGYFNLDVRNGQGQQTGYVAAYGEQGVKAYAASIGIDNVEWGV